MKMLTVVALLALGVAVSGCASVLGGNHGVFVNTSSTNAKSTIFGYHLGIPL